MKRIIWVVTAAALLLVSGLWIHEASAQVGSAKSRVKALEFRQFFHTVGPGAATTLFAVPAGSRFILTDVVISNGEIAELTEQSILSGQAIVSQFTVPARSTTAHSFASGLTFEGGSTIALQNGDSNETSTWTVTGYIAKG